jgi:dicarboxylate transporter 10
MTSDLIRQPDKRYNYSNAITGLINLIKTEGARGLGRGISTNTVRCEFYL